MEEAELLLSDLGSYGSGATAEIRVAIQQPSNQNAQTAAFTILDKLAQRIQAYYNLSLKIEQVFPLLLWKLCSGIDHLMFKNQLTLLLDKMLIPNFAGPLPPAEQIDSLQATCRQYARLIDFVLLFDTMKMCTPALQNDFSFYRRSMSREVTPGHFLILLNLSYKYSFTQKYQP